MALATLLAVSLQLNGLLMMWKIHQAKQNDAIWAALLCDETALLRHRPFNAFIAIAKNSGNRDVVFVWQKFSSPLTDQAALSYEHIENFTKDLEVRRDHGSRASPVNRAHMRGLQIKIETLMKYSKTQTHLSLFSLFLSLNSTFKGSLRRVGEKVLIIVAGIVVCSVL